MIDEKLFPRRQAQKENSGGDGGGGGVGSGSRVDELVVMMEIKRKVVDGVVIVERKREKGKGVREI